MTQGFLITNNPDAREWHTPGNKTVYLENGKFMDVLYHVRDMVHEGHILLTHPLSGSIKPGQTPYKSILVSPEKGELDTSSLLIIEDAIAIATKQIDEKPAHPWQEGALADFRLIDLDLIRR